MATRKLNRREREEVKRIFGSQRSAERCSIVKELRSEADYLVSAYTNEIDDLENKLKHLNQIRSDVLKEHCLLDFDPNKYSGCRNVDLHPRLMKFDEDTDRMLVQLITEEIVPIDVKSVITKVLEE